MSSKSHKKISLIDIKKLPPILLLRQLNKMKKKLKLDEVIISMFKEYDIDLDELDLIPMTFADLDVSAKCDHGIIYFNYKLLSNGSFEDCYSYATHEITHFLQQTSGDKPTKGSEDGNYLHNEFEQEGFKNQIEYIAEHNGENEAKKYVDHLLDHHEVKDDDREDLQEVLMENI